MLPFELDWDNPPYLPHKDNRTIKQKIKDDIRMIIEPSNIFPLNGWFDVWKQLFRHLCQMIIA